MDHFQHTQEMHEDLFPSFIESTQLPRDTENAVHLPLFFIFFNLFTQRVH